MIKKPTRHHLLFYFTSYRLDMFRVLLCPSPGACDYAVELPRWSFRSWFAVCWLLASNTQQTTKETINAVIQQHSHKLLMMGIIMPETCRAYKK
jgi:hypothetical protein